MNVSSNRNLDYARLGVDRVLQAGMQPQLTVWAAAPGGSPSTPSATPPGRGRVVPKVATRFKDKVSRYTIQNEPDIFTVEEGSCDSTELVQSLRRAGLKRITTYKLKWKKKWVRKKRYKLRGKYRYRVTTTAR